VEEEEEEEDVGKEGEMEESPSYWGYTGGGRVRGKRHGGRSEQRRERKAR
jgi:hypothetical protein